MPFKHARGFPSGRKLRQGCLDSCLVVLVGHQTLLILEHEVVHPIGMRASSDAKRRLEVLLGVSSFG
jgi:hypothetical protein